MDRFLRLKEVLMVTGFKRSTLYAKIGAGEFPRPISLGARAVGWRESEIDAVNAALTRGQSGDQLRATVREIVERRRFAA